jgi:phosphatidate cytidylyltransferase
MHRKRWITGLVALPFLIYLIYAGGVAFALMITVAALLAFWEYFRIALKTEADGFRTIVTAIGYLTAILMVAATHRYSAEMLIVVLGANIIISGLVFLFFFNSTPKMI